MDYLIENIDESLASDGFYGGTRWAIARKADESTPTHISIWLEPVKV